ncbi:competence type IV pilus assembly protein ComGB [Staphylococcus nepalensis]|uniref:competence type IV pilus assembly protein ComGB n=1 Tax=Staphylococcus nepalensis TaxID=214473 RepID=UPI00226F9D26|nr:competence type IV pilus assembly protein ComGB [Staphylococcus nepalensis]MCY1038439.1 competence type IV pilus assembly protein ComGB [Staphylococcus nepalensis]
MKKHLIDIFSISQFMIINEKTRIELLQRLQNLLEHGFTLSESFNFLLQHISIKSPKLTAQIKAQLEQGAQCYQILLLLNYPKIIIMIIYFAEMFSELTSTLPHAQDYLLRNYKAKQQLLKTLQYPLLLMVIFIIMLIVLNHTIIPEFQLLYKNFDVELSTIQFILSSILTHLPKTLLVTLLTILLCVLLFYKYIKKLPIKAKYKIILRIPIVRKFFKFYKTYRLSTEFALFYKNGVNLYSIVDIYSKQKKDPYLVYLASELSSGTQQGYKLSEILGNISWFEKGLITFIAEGEKKGKLEIELKLYSDIIFTKIEQYTQILIKFIQPILFTVLGLFIIALYLVIMLPMFDLMQTIK